MSSRKSIWYLSILYHRGCIENESDLLYLTKSTKEVSAMKIKKTLSVVLAALFCVSAWTFTGVNKDSIVSQVHNNETDKVSSDVDLAATNSVGKYISHLAMQDEETKAQALGEYSGYFSIEEMSFYSDTGVLLVKSSQAIDCNLKIDIINEETNVSAFKV